MENTNLIKCPKCGSTQITANKKGFSGKKAVAGAILTGGVGLLAGTIGSNKVKITCLGCGNEFRPGEGLKEGNVPEIQKAPQKMTTGAWVVLIILILIIAIIIYSF